MSDSTNNRVTAHINESGLQLNRQIGDQLISLVTRFFTEERIQVISANTVINTETETPINLNEVRERFVFYHLTKERGEGQLKRAFDLALIKMVKSRVSAVTVNLKYSPELEKSGEHELKKWLTAVTGQSDSELEYEVMRHFIWQVKRKLAGQPVQYHLMPILYGRIQGSGKSTAIRRLLDPVKTLTLNGKSIDFVTDEKNYKALGDYFVCFFDEMSGMDKADESALKQIITADQLAYRVFYTQSSSETPQNCTFIGSSNRSVIELIKDTTGARRFFELRAQDKFDYEIINSVNYNAIWASINESAPASFYESRLLEKLKVEQETYKRDEAFTEWLVERNYIPVDAKMGANFPSKQIKLKELWNDYKEYSLGQLGRTEMDAIHKNIFSRKLKNQGFETIRKGSGEFFIMGLGSGSMSMEGAPTFEGKGLTRPIIKVSKEPHQDDKEVN